MSTSDERDPVTLHGEQWEPIHEPEGWRNTNTGKTAGIPWMAEELAEEEKGATERPGH